MVPKALQLGSQDLQSVHRSGKSLLGLLWASVMSTNQSAAGRNKNNELVWILSEGPVEATVRRAVETCLSRQKAMWNPQVSILWHTSSPHLQQVPWTHLVGQELWVVNPTPSF